MQAIDLLLQSCICVALLQHTQCWENPGFISDEQRLILDNPFEWNKLKPDALRVSFDSSKMYGSCVLDLYGYSESGKSQISKTTSPFEHLASGSFLANQDKGSIDVLGLGFKCKTTSTGSSCALYHMGYMVLKCKDIADTRVSPVVGLGWLVHEYYTGLKWDTWAQAHCQNWYSLEDPKVRSAVRSVSCHPLRDYARANSAEYGIITAEKNLPRFSVFWRSKQTLKIIPPQECYLSVPDVDAMATGLHAAPVAMCCYASPSDMSTVKSITNWTFVFKEAENPNMDIMLHGSSSLRAHPAGVETFQAGFYLPGQVPHLSHWYWDLLPYHYCCIWWQGGSCVDYYMKARPSPKLKAPDFSFTSAFLLANLIARPFEKPPPSNVAPFICGGIGEYWLVKNDAFKVQIRTARVSSTMTKDSLLKPKNPARAMSTGPFVTGVAFSVSSLPNLIFRFISSEKTFSSNLFVTDTTRGDRTDMINNPRINLFGFVTMSEAYYAISNTAIITFSLSHKGERLGITVFLCYPEYEFMSVMVTAGKNSSEISGLMGGSVVSTGSAGSSGNGSSGAGRSGPGSSGPGSGRLAYSSLCEANKVEAGHQDNLFNGKSNSGDSESSNSSSSTAATAAPGTRPPAVKVKELSISGKSMQDAKDIACLSTGYDKYCSDIETSLNTMQSLEKTILDCDPKRDPFRYCTTLPPSRGLMVHIGQENSGLRVGSTLYLMCSGPFRAAKAGESTCQAGDTKAGLQYSLPVGFGCSLTDIVQKQDQGAEDWFRVNNGSTEFNQHLETYQFEARIAKIKKGGGGGDSGSHGPLVADSWVLIILIVVTSTFIGGC